MHFVRVCVAETEILQITDIGYRHIAPLVRQPTGTDETQETTASIEVECWTFRGALASTGPNTLGQAELQGIVYNNSFKIMHTKIMVMPFSQLSIEQSPKIPSLVVAGESHFDPDNASVAG